MNEQELRAVVEQLVRQYAGQAEEACPVSAPAAQRPEGQSHPPAQQEDGCLDDITTAEPESVYLVEHPQNGPAFLELKQKTPARIGMGRAGARYKTMTQLRMRADHAAAQDSVFSMVSDELPQKEGWISVQTLCKDKDEYLTRPDLGRRLGEEAQAAVRAALSSPTVTLVVGDGLSSAAIEANAPDCVAAIRQGLQSKGIPCSDPIFVTYCRVGVSDHIGELTGAEVVCMLVGERPGLTTAESMSAYLTYKPHIGIAEAKRTVISNIHKRGTTAVEAGAYAADLIELMLKQKASGIDLKRGSV